MTELEIKARKILRLQRAWLKAITKPEPPKGKATAIGKGSRQ
jgi:hypothetical protein